MAGKKNSKKKQGEAPVRKARHGVAVSLEEGEDGVLSLMMDAVERRPDSEPAEWVFQKNFVNHAHPAEHMENLQLSRKELAEIGETLMIWLMSKEGRLS